MRQTHAVYDPATGAILRRVACTPADLPLQLQPGEAATIAPDDVSSLRHRVWDGRVVPIPQVTQ